MIAAGSVAALAGRAALGWTEALASLGGLIALAGTRREDSDLPATGPVWRRILAAPPDVRLGDGAGIWCPLCDHALILLTDPPRWRCDMPSCRVEWTVQGLLGRWYA